MLKRRILVLFIIAVVCLAGGFVTGQLIQGGGISALVGGLFGGNDAEAEVGSIMTTGSYIVNVRKAPQSDAVVLATLNQNTEVQYLGEDNGWYKVELDSGESGYVMKNFLTFVDDVASSDDSESGGSTGNEPAKDSGSSSSPDKGSDDAGSGSTEKKVYITNEFANIRSGPSADTDKVTVLYEGDSATYVATEGDWYKLKLEDGSVGYVNTPLAEIR